MFNPGDVVRLRDDDRKMIVVGRLDPRLLWVRLVDPDRAQMYAFRSGDLMLVAALQPAAAMADAQTSVPQVPSAPSIAA